MNALEMHLARDKALCARIDELEAQLASVKKHDAQAAATQHDEALRREERERCIAVIKNQRNECDEGDGEGYEQGNIAALDRAIAALEKLK